MNRNEKNQMVTPAGRMAKIAACIALPLIIIICIIFAIEICAGDEVWLRNEYERLDINDYTGMSTDDQCAAFMQMVNYMQGSTDTMEIEVTVGGERVMMYNKSEMAHMDDVRRLYSGVMVFKWVALAFSAVALIAAFALLHKDAINFISKAYLIAFASVLGAFLLLGIWALVSFDSFWRVFHIVFLDLESSTFDPLYSRMIRICPPELFRDMVVRIFAFGLGLPAIAAVAAGIWRGIARRQCRNYLLANTK